MTVRIIAKRTLMNMARAHGDCVQQADDWYSTAREAKWHNLAEVRASFRHADVVGDKTVFNIKGNDYRLIVHINYQAGYLLKKSGAGILRTLYKGG